MYRRMIVGIFLITLLCSFSRATELQYTDLISRLTDLESLALLPQDGERTLQWSSYDRASKYDAQMDKYINWDANGDNGGYLRMENGEYVLGEMEGPGCIWRIWSARPDKGHIKIYLDGNILPVMDMPFQSLFERKNPPFIYPSLVYVASKGCNSFIPIPFQKSCKIVAEKEWGDYYHFTYSLFPKDTILPSFKLNLTEEEKNAFEKTDKFLLNEIGQDPAGKRKNEKTEIIKTVLHPNSFLKPIEIQGPQAITGIQIQMDTTKISNIPDVLRELTIKISWENETYPSVWVPLGDFFGTAPGINYYKSLPMGMTDKMFYSYWFMPFVKKAKIEIANEGNTPVPLTIKITLAPLTQPLENYARFHAKWHRDAYLPSESERQIDWPILKTMGQGRFCGVMLHVWNPKGGWWGEGDEKFFVDGEKFPSIFGTGSEDYFGYAWCDPVLFQKPYHNQTRNDGENIGHVSINRWQIVENVPFRNSFDGYIEKYQANSRPTQYSCVAYWYLSPDGFDPYLPIPVDDRKSYYIQPLIWHEPGSLEGEKLIIKNINGGNTLIQNMEIWGGWSGDLHLWWVANKPGNTLDLSFTQKDSGTFLFQAQFTKARDYAIIQLYLDGKKLGTPIDLYNEKVLKSGKRYLGNIDLVSGEHILRVEIVGANPKAIPQYMFGLDYIKLTPVQSR